MISTETINPNNSAKTATPSIPTLLAVGLGSSAHDFCRLVEDNTDVSTFSSETLFSIFSSKVSFFFSTQTHKQEEKLKVDYSVIVVDTPLIICVAKSSVGTSGVGCVVPSSMVVTSGDDCVVPSSVVVTFDVGCVVPSSVFVTSGVGSFVSSSVVVTSGVGSAVSSSVVVTSDVDCVLPSSVFVTSGVDCVVPSSVVVNLGCGCDVASSTLVGVINSVCK